MHSVMASHQLHSLLTTRKLAVLLQKDYEAAIQISAENCNS
jgi:hypothetical protein